MKKETLQNDSTKVLKPVRDSNGNFPFDITQEQLALLSAEEQADYFLQVSLANLNANTKKS